VAARTVNRVSIGNRKVKGDVFAVLRHVGSISGVAAHEDRYIATAGDDGRIILWDKATGKSVNSSLHDDVVNDCAFSRDGRYLVTSSNDCTARLWSVPDLSLKAVLADQGDDVTMSAFHPVDELIVTTSRDFFVRVYDFDARLVAEFGGVVGEAVWLDWTRDGRELVTLSNDGTMTRWPWAATPPIDAIGLGSAGGNDCGHAVAVKNRHATRVEARDTGVDRLVIDPRKSLLACVSDGALGVWDIFRTKGADVLRVNEAGSYWVSASLMMGMPRWAMLVFGRCPWWRSSAVSLSMAASRLIWRPWTSPSQPLIRASWIRSFRLAMMVVSRGRALGSRRRLGHLMQACSCLQLVP
jgi:toxoflavin biosynthesis protein ToxC